MGSIGDPKMYPASTRSTTTTKPTATSRPVPLSAMLYLLTSPLPSSASFVKRAELWVSPQFAQGLKTLVGSNSYLWNVRIVGPLSLVMGVFRSWQPLLLQKPLTSNALCHYDDKQVAHRAQAENVSLQPIRNRGAFRYHHASKCGLRADVALLGRPFKQPPCSNAIHSYGTSQQIDSTKKMRGRGIAASRRIFKFSQRFLVTFLSPILSAEVVASLKYPKLAAFRYQRSAPRRSTVPNAPELWISPIISMLITEPLAARRSSIAIDSLGFVRMVF